MMTQITDSHICCVLTKFYYELQIRNGELIWVDEKGFGHYATLPEGTWQFLFTTDGVTEEQAATLVRSSDWHFPVRHKRFVDYAFPFDRENKQRWSEGFATAKESLASLLKSKGLPEGNYAILKKV
jgi:hypothetical protein